MPGTGAVSGLPRVATVTAPVRSQVADMLRAAIISLELKPGDRLVERELCEATGASRAPVREALRQLEAEGLVYSTGAGGPIVAFVTPSEAAEIYDVRALLEGYAAARFAEKASDDEREELVGTLQAIEAAGVQGDVTSMLGAKNAFYDVLLRGARNQTVDSTLRGLHARVTLLRSTSLSQSGRPQQTIEEIRRVVECALAHDADGARRAMEEHVRNAGEVALSELRRTSTGSGMDARTAIEETI